MVFGVAVVNTIGIDVVSTGAINMYVILAALLSAILWILLTWFFMYSQQLLARPSGRIYWLGSG